MVASATAIAVGFKLKSVSVAGANGGNKGNLRSQNFIQNSNSKLFGRMVGRAPEMEIQVCCVLTQGLLGSGSAVTTMSKSFFDRLSPRSELRHVRELVVTIADGSTVPFHGYVEADFEIPVIAGSSVTVPCPVVSDTDNNRQVPIIIGTSYMLHR